MTRVLGGLPDSLLVAAQIICAMILTTLTLERRDRFGLRACGVAACAALFIGLVRASGINAQGYAGGSPTARQALLMFSSQMLLFCLVLALCVAAVLVLFRARLATALFCVSMGYVMQNIGGSLFGLLLTLAEPAGIDTRSWWFELLGMVVLFAVVYLACYLILLRHVEGEALYGVGGGGSFALMVLAVLICLVFDLCNKAFLPMFDAPVGIVVAYRAIQLVMCGLLLWMVYEYIYNQKLARDAAVLDKVRADGERQYELSRQTIDAINMKAHDLKHEIRRLEDGGQAVVPGVLEDLRHEVDVYDSSVHTGNAVLDTILTEKKLLCEHEGIRLTCMADGEALDAMAPADLYSLFGNILDNAIEAVRAFEAPDRRSISLLVEHKGAMAVIHEENWCAETPDFANGLPQTTKPDVANHGFGTRSIRGIAERHGGTATFRVEEGRFAVNVILPAEQS